MSAKAVKEMVPSQASGVYRGLHKDVQGNEVAVPPKIGATIYIYNIYWLLQHTLRSHCCEL